MLKITAIFIVVFSFTGCENDFDSIGSDIIGAPNFNAALYEDAEISARTHRLTAVQTNNLPVHLLGVYNDPVFGLEQANVLSQLELSSTNPTFGTEPVLDSVVLTIPYFSTEGETSEDGVVEYELDSLYGMGPVRLSIEESGLFLNNFDPETDFEDTQKYYSNMHPRIEENLTGNVILEEQEFLPSGEEVIYFEENEEGVMDTLRLAPRMRLKLSTEFFQEKILDMAGSGELSSNNNFQNYLRGLYFNVEPVNNEGTMMLLNFKNSEAGITLYYTTKQADADDADDDGDTEELVNVQESFELGLGQNIVNTFEQESPQFQDDRLYLRGGQGSMAVIELFSGSDADGDGVSDDLESLRESEWLINEANLIFFVDQQEMAAGREPERLYLFDLDNGIMLADYRFETPGQVNPMTSTINDAHLGPLVRDDSENGVSYKMRMTEHVRRVINADSTNVRLGLVVSQNVNLIANSAVKESSDVEIEKIPSGSIISPLGTVLYGPEAENEEKRLKLQIFYTEPKN